jgi:hypothetical protein
MKLVFSYPGGATPLWAKASHQPSSVARRLAETKVGSRAEQVDRVCIEPRKKVEVVVHTGISRSGLPDSRRANADSFNWLERSILPDAMVRPVRDHRGRRPGHVDTRIARELGRASSLPVQKIADQCGGSTSGGVHRVTKAPGRKGPWLRRVDPWCAEKAEATGREGRAG